MNVVLRALLRPLTYLASVLGVGQRCGARSQLLPAYGDMPVTCQRHPGHRGFHKDGIAVWDGSDPYSHRPGGPA